MPKNPSSAKERNGEYNEETCTRAKKRCLYLLQARAYTEYKLREKLRQGGYLPQVIDEALEYVKSFHYVDDYDYACQYIFYHRESETRRKMEEKLLGKGIEREILQRAMEASYESREEQQELELAQAKKLLEKKRDSYDLENPVERQKLYAFMARRGISGDTICKVLHLYQKEA